MLIVGKHKTDTFLENLPERFLLIDDGTIIDQLEGKHFDITTHSFKPLMAMNYRKAEQFVEVLKSAFPEGENTLTKATFEFQVMQALMEKKRSLQNLIPDTKETQYAYQKIQRILMSPVLKNVLTRKTNFSFKGKVLVRLDRKELGDFDCFLLGNLIIQQYKGVVVIPDYGFYACPFHLSLMDRLIAGVNFLEEVPLKLRNALLLMDEKIAAGTTYDDAQTLAKYAGYVPDTPDYNPFIKECMTVPESD